MKNSSKCFLCVSKATVECFDFIMFVADFELPSSKALDLYYSLYNLVCFEFFYTDPKTYEESWVSSPPFRIELKPLESFPQKELKILVKHGFISVYHKNDVSYVVLNKLSLKQIAMGYIMSEYRDAEYDFDVLWFKVFEDCWNMKSWNKDDEFDDLGKLVNERMLSKNL